MKKVLIRSLALAGALAFSAPDTVEAVHPNVKKLSKTTDMDSGNERGAKHDPEVLKELFGIKILMLNQRKAVYVILNPNRLQHHPTRYLNGHLVSVLVFGREKITATLGGQPLKPMIHHKDCKQIMVFNDHYARYGVLKPDTAGLNNINKLDGESLFDYAQRHKVGDIPGFYSKGGVHHRGKPLFPERDTVVLRLTKLSPVLPPAFLKTDLIVSVEACFV